MTHTQRARGPLLLGLTGGIGAGKSTVAALLRARGAGVVDADAVAREVVEVGEPALQALADEFGEGVLAVDGSLDRPALAALAFVNPERTAALNAIMHPAIGERTQERLAELADHDVVVHDVPLLVENGMTGRYHLSLLVDVPEDVRLMRLTTKRGLDPEDARRRIRAQADDDARRRACDVVLDNSTSEADLARRFETVWTQRIAPFQRNRAAGLPAAQHSVQSEDRGVDALQAAGHRLLARLTHAAHAAGISSSGVMGTGSEAVEITLRIEGTTDRTLLSQMLADAGFPRTPGAAGEFATADPGQPATVHITEATR